MRLSQPLFASIGFQFSSVNDLIKALENQCSKEELDAAIGLFSAKLPPITSVYALSTMLGVNPGLIWSFQHRTKQYYREFYIKKGQGQREIQAPRVALKLIQKWVSVVLGNTLIFPSHVFGFVQGRSHIDAAIVHVGARWIFGIDIRDFFRTTPQHLVQKKFEALGYPVNGARLLSSLTCLGGFLAQGAPSSPVLSNLCFSELDQNLVLLAEKYRCRLSRYADDIVFSGHEVFPEELKVEVMHLFIASPWNLAPEKTEIHTLPHRLKVHGLLVDGDRPRLTKGYRNKLRAFRHVLASAKHTTNDGSRLAGHVAYANYVERIVQLKST